MAVPAGTAISIIEATTAIRRALYISVVSFRWIGPGRVGRVTRPNDAANDRHGLDEVNRLQDG
ncbi:hypothetical protein ABT063_40555 [Streptomyces sp. NPDC002838]|uniref:hypothetical protein n=1 Tax=Streptomyces sp. NPDC002838 TaxID=3154436 RepID=UPI003323EAAC